MNKFFLAAFFAVLFLSSAAQKISQTTIKRFSMGADIYTDIWLNKPDGIDTRTINQAASFFGMYNKPFGESNVSFAIGIGLGMHNLYTKGRIEDIKADTIVFVPIPDSISYKKYKLGLTYIDVPVELRLKTENKFRFAIGFKVGYLIDGKTKYKGNREDGQKVVFKEKQVNQLENVRFGPTIRIGYDWFNLYAYYSVTKVFKKGKGPETYPLSVGITLLPF